MLRGVENMNRERERLHWLTLVFPKGCWSLKVVTLFQLCSLPELVCVTDGAPSPACQWGPTGRCTRLSALGLGDRSASRSVRRADIYQATEEFWRHEGHFNESRARAVWVNSFRASALTSPRNIYTMKLGRRKISTVRKEMEEGDWTRPIGRRSRWSWRSTFTPSMTSNQVSITSAMAKWRQTQWMFRTHWPSGVNRAGSSPLR